MRIARKLMLLAIMAIAALALAAPAAFAHTAPEHNGTSTEPEPNHSSPEIEVRQEGGANPHCPDVGPVPTPVSPTLTTGGCRIHATGQIRFFVHISGVETTVTICNAELFGRVDRRGRGWISHTELTGAQCTRIACGSEAVTPPDEHRAWRFQLRETAAGQTRATVLFCLETVGTHASPTHCEVEVPFTETVNHRYNFNLDGSPVGEGVTCHGLPVPTEFSGQFNSEAVLTTIEGQQTQQIEINHT